MAQTAPGSDATQRLFGELKSKNEETRARASYDLCDNVLAVSRGNIYLNFTKTMTETNGPFWRRTTTRQVPRIL